MLIDGIRARRLGLQAILFTAVVVAFIMDILSPQLQLVPNLETLALLCDLANKMGHAAFATMFPNNGLVVHP